MVEKEKERDHPARKNLQIVCWAGHLQRYDSSCASLSKSKRLFFAVIWQHVQVWTPWNLITICVMPWPCRKEQLMLTKTLYHVTNVTSAIYHWTFHGRCFLTLTLNRWFRKRVRQFSWEHFSDCVLNWSFTVLWLFLCFFVEVQAFGFCCDLTACSGMKAMEPHWNLCHAMTMSKRTGNNNKDLVSCNKCDISCSTIAVPWSFFCNIQTERLDQKKSETIQLRTLFRLCAELVI